MYPLFHDPVFIMVTGRTMIGTNLTERRFKPPLRRTGLLAIGLPNGTRLTLQ